MEHRRPRAESSAYKRLDRSRADRLAVEVEALIGDSEAALIDARSENEFTGERFWPSGATEGAGRPGHIPGAIHLPVDLARNEDGSLPTAMSCDACEGPGIDRSKIVTDWTIGTVRSHVAFALSQVLGFPRWLSTTLWSEWGTATIPRSNLTAHSVR